MRMRLKKIIWSHYGKCIILLLLLTVFLQGYHIMYMVQSPEHMEHNPRTIHRYMAEQPSILQEDLRRYVKHIERAHKMDHSGTYMFIPNIVAPYSQEDDVDETLTVCSQSTANNLHYLTNLSQTWDGPISVTVFTHGHDTVIALYTIAYLHACFEQVKQSVSFHVVYPILYPPSNIKTILNMEMHCDNVESLLTNKSKVNYGDLLPYPHNVLRNIAVEYSSTSYILMIDIDMIPSHDLNRLFEQFIRRRSILAGNGRTEEKMVYVIPAFESQTHIGRINKESLLKEWDVNNIRPFYERVCWKCQKVTEYEKWRSLPGLHFLDIGYILQWENPWEPIYIARKQDLPLYDDRFKQYGFNRISHVSCTGQQGSF